jgi:hypothetical protein
MSQQPEQQQTPPSSTSAMMPRRDHGEDSYPGSGRLRGQVAEITGSDSATGGTW